MVASDTDRLLLLRGVGQARPAHGLGAPVVDQMEGDAPVGGKWNFDRDNRKAPPEEITALETLAETLDRASGSKATEDA